MCKWRQVQHIFSICDHVYSLPDELIQCDDRFCKFSTTHPADCGPDCKNSCWQYRQFPEQYNRTIPRLCYACEEAARLAAAQATQAERTRRGGR